MRRVRTALAAGLALTVAAVTVVLSQSPVTVLASNSTAAGESLAFAAGDASACQSGEQIPRGTVAIRLSLGAFTGSAVSVEVLAGTHVVASGERGSGWDGHTVTVPVGSVSHAISPAQVCFAGLVAGGERLTVFGSRAASSLAAHARGGAALSGRLRIEYLGKGTSSWLALLPSVVRNMALGRAWSGTWVVFMVAMLMLATTILVFSLLVRELDE
jgi:hypothetical protein